MLDLLLEQAELGARQTRGAALLGAAQPAISSSSGMGRPVGHQRRQQPDLALAPSAPRRARGSSLEVGDQRVDARRPSNGSSMCLRTKSVRLPTDFIDTV